jgi:hypothetical protein
MLSVVVGVPAVTVVPTVVPSTGVSASSGVLLLSALPDIPVLSCAGIDPAVLVFLTAVDLSGILAVATMLLLASLLFFAFLLLLTLHFYRFL